MIFSEISLFDIEKILIEKAETWSNFFRLYIFSRNFDIFGDMDKKRFFQIEPKKRLSKYRYFWNYGQKTIQYHPRKTRNVDIYRQKLLFKNDNKKTYVRFLEKWTFSEI